LQEPYYWEGAKDAMSINRTVKKIQFKMREKHQREATEDEIVHSYKILLASIKDEWILNNLSPAMVDSKFNQIVGTLKNTNDQFTKARGQAERSSHYED
jgi:hypothetical protein